ncbi:hypothetical protein ADK59_26460 [Streptomyces sp. XY332]|nr:hypothetical protein ADK59_26460 [Streptomyces sp. XY332]
MEVAVGGGPGDILDLVAGELRDDAAQVLLPYGLAVRQRRDVGKASRAPLSFHHISGRPGSSSRTGRGETIGSGAKPYSSAR